MKADLIIKSLIALVCGRKRDTIDIELPEELEVGGRISRKAVYVIRDEREPGQPVCGWKGKDPQAFAAAFALLAHKAGLPIKGRTYAVCRVRKATKRRLKVEVVGQFEVRDG